MASFRFESQEVQAEAADIEKLGGEIKELLDGKLTNQMADLQKEWKSNAAAAYARQFENIKANFVKFYEAIQNMSDAINAASAAYNKTDEANNVSGGM